MTGRRRTVARPANVPVGRFFGVSSGSLRRIGRFPLAERELISVAYRIGIKNRAGTRMAIFTEVTDPETQQRQLTVVFQHPSVDAEALARMRRLAERTWRQGRDSGGSRPRNESPAT